MNLIEQLGRYAAAKIRLSGSDKSLSYYQELNAELLEYRRQHNIFEVGDNVVCCVTDRVGLIDCFIGDYFCMVKIKNDVGSFTFIKNHVEAIKHAEGKRLP